VNFFLRGVRSVYFLVKVIFIYIVFIVAVNILGKSALAQLTPHDFGAILFFYLNRKLKESRYPLPELLSNLRTTGYPDIHDNEYAILEATGEISIFPRKELVPITPKDLHMKVEYRGLPIAVVIEGKVQKRKLKFINKNEKWLKEELKAKGYLQIKEIFFFFYAAVRDTDHSLTINKKDVND
jgi:uncharacterized membrane protein YcaP (DUF421 family)